MPNAITFSVPTYEPDTAPFWAGVAERRFLVNRCPACGRAAPAFSSTCAYCGATPVDLVEAGGRGTVYSWTVCHRALDPVFVEDVPYTIVAVRLDEGAMVYGRLVDVPPTDVRADLPVEITWLEVGADKQPVWAFRARADESP